MFGGLITSPYNAVSVDREKLSPGGHTSTSFHGTARNYLMSNDLTRTFVLPLGKATGLIYHGKELSPTHLHHIYVHIYVLIL